MGQKFYSYLKLLIKNCQLNFTKFQQYLHLGREWFLGDYDNIISLIDELNFDVIMYPPYPETPQFPKFCHLPEIDF